jgi:hypothetical protein
VGKNAKCSKDGESLYTNDFWSFTGISLGAGVASILGMMLKEQYPNLKCAAYMPPGTLLAVFPIYRKPRCISFKIINDIITH